MPFEAVGDAGKDAKKAKNYERIALLTRLFIGDA